MTLKGYCKYHRLTRRQRDVLIYFLQYPFIGYKEMLPAFNYNSEQVVKNHMRAIMAKFDVSSKMELFFYCLTNGLVEIRCSCCGHPKCDKEHERQPLHIIEEVT